ncbi:MAG TPA: hypothetical protein VEH27_14765 [Methylomirabilota bacterium]|nr:hypothetical protein [Methylomirabilota bacterium]
MLDTPASDELDVWTIHSSVNLGSTVADITYGDGRFVLVGAKAMMSTNGIDWVTTHPDLRCVKVVYGNGRFVALGTSGKDYATSDDGFFWSFRSLGTSTVITRLDWDGTSFVLAGGSFVWRSADGVSWVREAIPQRDGYFLACAGKKYLVGTPDATWISTNLLDWQRCSNIVGNVSRMLLHNNQLLALSDRGIQTSKDGLQWKRSDFAGTPSVLAVHRDVVLVGLGSTIWTSLDGDSWSRRPTPSSNLGIVGLVSDGNAVVGVIGTSSLRSGDAPLNQPRLQLILAAGVRIQGAIGRRYAIQSTLDLLGGIWRTEDVIQLPTADFTWHDPSPLDTRKMYRAVAQ